MHATHAMPAMPATPRFVAPSVPAQRLAATCPGIAAPLTRH